MILWCDSSDSKRSELSELRAFGENMVCQVRFQSRFGSLWRRFGVSMASLWRLWLNMAQLVTSVLIFGVNLASLYRLLSVSFSYICRVVALSLNSLETKPGRTSTRYQFRPCLAIHQFVRVVYLLRPRIVEC